MIISKRDGKISAQNLQVNLSHSRLPQAWDFWCGWALGTNEHPMSAILFFTAYLSLTSSYIIHSWQGQLTEKNLYPVILRCYDDASSYVHCTVPLLFF